MVLYDTNFELLGISQATLELFGYSSFGAFCAVCSDISQIIIEKDGFFRSESNFIKDLISVKNKFVSALIRTANGGVIDVKITLSPVFANDGNMSFYEVDFIATSSLKYNLIETNLSANEEKKSSLPNLFLSEYKRLLKARGVSENPSFDKQNKQSKTKSNLDFIDEKLLHEISERLDINVDELNGMVSNLILEAKKVDDEFHKALLAHDRARINEIVNFLLDPINVLGIRPLKDILEELVSASDDEISSKFEIYRNILENLNKIVAKGSMQWN